MPGIAWPTPFSMGHILSPDEKTSLASSSIPDILESEGHYISSKKPYHPALELPRAPESSSPRLATPLSKEERRIIKKTKRLISRRNTLDREILRAVKKSSTSANDWLPRDELLQRSERLEKKELRHLRKYTKKLAKLKRVYRRDPSSHRACDYDLVRSLLWRFKRNLGPLLDEYANHCSEEDNSKGRMDSFGIDPDWDMELINIDEELQQKTAKQKEIDLQNTVTTKHSTNEMPLDVLTSMRKEKRKEGLAEEAPTKKVRFVLKKETDDLTSREESKIKEIKGNKGQKRKHASIQGEAQTSGK
ncbi:hypothetical protein F4825DRAFT_213221 [Nemania diffusa]|nr:hypothetical protein F4825DRAFT_213221 [Nemania diffusa]